MKIDVFTVGLNIDERTGDTTPIIHFDGKLEQMSSLDQLKEILGEEDTIKLAEIAIEFLNKLREM